MPKKKIIIFIVVLLLIVNIPRRYQLKDGGTIVYKSLLWEYDKLHRMNENNGYDVGKTFDILGIEVYRNVTSVERENL